MTSNTFYPLGFGPEFYTNICCLRCALRAPPCSSQLVCGDRQFIFNVSNTFMLARLERPLVKLLVCVNSLRFRSILHTFSLTALIILTVQREVKEPVGLANRNSVSGQNPKSVESSSLLFSIATRSPTSFIHVVDLHEISTCRVRLLSVFPCPIHVRTCSY